MSIPFKPRPDGRIHIGAPGEFPCVIGGKRKRQIVTPADLERLVANRKADGARDVLPDIDHESLDPAKRTEVAGDPDLPTTKRRPATIRRAHAGERHADNVA